MRMRMTFGPARAQSDGWTILDVLRDRITPLGVPVLGSLPLGHGSEALALPIGTHEGQHLLRQPAELRHRIAHGREPEGDASAAARRVALQVRDAIARQPA